MSVKLLAVPTACPKCGGKLWDNRESKKNPKAPDFKCRNKQCDGCYWPPRGAERWADQASAPQHSEPPEYGDPIAGLDGDDTGEVLARAKDGASWEQRVTKINALMQGYDLFFDHALQLAEKVKRAGYPVTMEGINAAAAVLAIRAADKGLL